MKLKKQHVYVVVATSESGDHYGPWCFSTCPTEEQLKSFLADVFKDSGEFDTTDGPGTWGTYLHVVGPGKTELLP